MRSSRARLGLAALLAMLVHGLLGYEVYTTPPVVRPPPVPKKVDKYAELKTIRETVKLPEPPPPKEEEPPPPPKEEPPPPVELPKEEAKPKPPPKKAKKKRMAKAKPKDAPKPEPKPEPVVKPAEPKPFTLTNVNLTGGVAVQKGDSDMFGDPSVAATKSNTRPDPEDDEEVGDPSGTADGVGAAPARKPKRILPKVAKNVRGVYPSDAPRYGRVIEVKLTILVGPSGKATKIKVVKGAGGAFDREAKAVAKRLRFEPGTLDGKPTSMWVPWVVAFEPAD